MDCKKNVAQTQFFILTTLGFGENKKSAAAKTDFATALLHSMLMAELLFYSFDFAAVVGFFGSFKHCHDFQRFFHRNRRFSTAAQRYEVVEHIDRGAGNRRCAVNISAIADPAAVSTGADHHLDQCTAAVFVFDLTVKAIVVGQSVYRLGAHAHHTFQQFKGMYAVPDDQRITFRAFAQRTPRHSGFYVQLSGGKVFNALEVAQFTGGKELDIAFFSDSGNGFCIFQSIGKGFIQKDRLAQLGAFLEIFQVKFGVVDFQKDRVAISNGFVKVFGYQYAQRFQLLLAGIQTFFARKARLFYSPWRL